MIFARISAILYIVWGVLHLAAASQVWSLAQTVDPGNIQGRLFQDAFYLASFAVGAILIALFFNFRNSVTGYWMNTIMVAIADIPFILFILLPGYLPLFPGVLGPAIWALAVITGTIGILSRKSDRG